MVEEAEGQYRPLCKHPERGQRETLRHTFGDSFIECLRALEIVPFCDLAEIFCKEHL